MKQAAVIFLFSLAILQVNWSEAQPIKVASVDQFNVIADNLSLVDSSAGGRMLHIVVMDFAIRDAETGSALKALYASVAEKKQLNLSIKTMDFTGKITEERVYSGAIVQELVLPVMDGADRNTAKIQVKIRASSFSLLATNGTVSKMPSAKGPAVISANFRFNLGALPGHRIAKISAIRIAGGQLAGVVIDVAETDAKPWQNWLLSSASKKEQGNIEWLAPNTTDVVFRIELRDMEITSASSNYASNSQTIQRMKIGLRGQVAILPDGK